LGKILKDITRYSPQDKVNFFIKNLPKECQENFDITFDFLKKLGFSELLDKVDNFDISQSFYTYRDDLVDKTKSNFEKIDAFVDTLPVGNRLQAMIDQTNSCMYLFYEYTGDNVDFIAGLDTSNVTDMSEMFYKCQNLTTIPQLDTGRVTNMISMFFRCESLTTMPAFDTSKVTSMYNMFSFCRSLTTIPAFDTSKVTDMGSMFYNCSNIEQIHLLNIGTNLDISACTKMTREALLEVIGNLKDLTGSTSKKLTLGSTNLAKLTEDDIALATNKNWTLA
jgi:surface protein